MYEFNLVWLVSHLLTILGFALALLLVSSLLRSRRSPSSTLAWLLIILMLPYVGVPLYLMFGGRKMRRRAGQKEQVYHEPESVDEMAGDGPVERVLRSNGVPPAAAHNAAEPVTRSEDAYRLLIDLIDGAKQSIYITTFILGRDSVAEAIVARLARRASEGVAVRLLLDDLGSWRTGRRFLAPLTAAGGKVARFMPVLHMPFRGRTNLRNHRKIIVVDGQHAMMGGMNLAEPYMGPNADANRWRDFSEIVSGPVVGELTRLFLSDWKFATDEELARDDDTVAPLESGSAIAQVVASGPDVSGDPLYEALVSAFLTAKQRIWVVTPYFIPDEMLARALDLAARRGIDVRLVLPARSNHVTADLARASYVRQVHDAGGHVLLFQPVMLHAKVVLVDDRIAIVGSANMDMRSLFLNYEVALFLYSKPEIAAIASWIDSLAAESTSGLPAQSRVREMLEDVVRLLSPLL